MTSQLQRVTITGADDNTDILELIELTERYPFVEWALLYYPAKERTPRNPSKEWRESFLTTLSYHMRDFYHDSNKPYPSRQHTALHLCGRFAFYQLLADALPGEVRRYGRLQLNVNAREPEFTNAQVLEIYEKALKLGPEIILQSHEHTEMLIQIFLGRLLPEERARVHVLNDSSRGKGLVPDMWFSTLRNTEVFEGFAGGLNPDNLKEQLQQLNRLEVPYWIDMETGVRTNNMFDVAKVERVLKLCQVHIQQS